MLRRMVRAYGPRIGQDHKAGLGHLRDIEAELTDAVNLGIYTANRVGGVSINQLAAELRVSKQAIHKRVLAGAQIARQREQPAALAPARVVRSEPAALPSGSTGSPTDEPTGHHIRVQMEDGSWRERILYDLDDPILDMNTRVIYARTENRPPNRKHVAALRAWVTGEPESSGD